MFNKLFKKPNKEGDNTQKTIYPEVYYQNKEEFPEIYFSFLNNVKINIENYEPKFNDGYKRNNSYTYLYKNFFIDYIKTILPLKLDLIFPNKNFYNSLKTTLYHHKTDELFEILINNFYDSFFTIIDEIVLVRIQYFLCNEKLNLRLFYKKHLPFDIGEEKFNLFLSDLVLNQLIFNEKGYSAKFTIKTDYYFFIRKIFDKLIQNINNTSFQINEITKEKRRLIEISKTHDSFYFLDGFISELNDLKNDLKDSDHNIINKTEITTPALNKNQKELIKELLEKVYYNISEENISKFIQFDFQNIRLEEPLSKIDICFLLLTLIKHNILSEKSVKPFLKNLDIESSYSNAKNIYKNNVYKIPSNKESSRGKYKKLREKVIEIENYLTL